MCCDATDSQDNMLFKISGLGEETTEMLMKHKDRFEEGSTLVTDSKRIFDKFANKKTWDTIIFLQSFIKVIPVILWLL